MDKLITNLDTNLGTVLREQLDTNFQKIQNGVDGQADSLNKQIETMLGDVPLQDKNEVTQARIDSNDVPYQTLKGRLDVNQSTAETALDEERQTGLEVKTARSASSGKVYPTLNDRLNAVDANEASLANSINMQLSQISSVPITFANLSDLKAAYPTGKAGLFVTANDGHKFIWSNNSWVDAGVYQSVGISDASVAPEKLTTSIIPNNKKLNNYGLLSKTTDLYIINDAISRSGIVNITGKFGAGNITLFLLEKRGFNYFVKSKYSTAVENGWSSIPTNFYATGDGNEYIGVLGGIYYSTTGGNGFYSFESANVDAKYFSVSTLITDYDFSIFNVYENIEIVNKLENTINKVNDQTKIVNDQTKIVTTDDYKNMVDFKYVAMLKNFVNNKTLDKGNVIANVSVPFSQQGKLYIVERDNVNFTVKKELDVTLTAGINTFDLKYETTGNGKEYLGVYAQINYTANGGNGYFETLPEDTSSYNEGDTFTTDEKTNPTIAGGTYNLALFAQYSKTINKFFSENNDNIEYIKSQLPTIKLSDYLTPKYSVISDSIGFVGRWFDTELNGIPVKATINEGSEFYFKVKNTTLVNINFIVNSVKATPFFAYSIDGSEFTRQLITSPTLPVMSTDEHIIRVVVDGLTETEDKWVGEKGVALKDVTVEANGVLTGLLPKNKKIMFFGDSITEGIRVLNMNADSTGNSAAGAWPFIASEKLNSISYRVGFGASGVTKGGSGGVPKLIENIDNMTQNRKTPYYEPDLIVINIGTNDGNSTSSDFITQFNAVLDRLSIKYSGTPIFVMIPFNGAKRSEITTCVNDRTNIYLIDTNGWEISTTDGTHPNLDGGITAGTKVAGEITKTLGKNYFI